MCSCGHAQMHKEPNNGNFQYSRVLGRWTLRGVLRRVWGLNNREAPLRLCTDAHGEPNNAEYKTLDATANPYLALAVLIIAGLEVWDPHLPEDESTKGISRGGSRLLLTRKHG